MKHLFVLLASLCFICILPSYAQQSSPEEMEKMLFESVDREVEKQTTMLNLADWQIFRLDSLLTHDYKSMTAELQSLQKEKVSNGSAYMAVQDKWYEEIYNGYRSILNDEQWAKYLKSGAARAKTARDKRASKAAVMEAKMKEKNKKK